MSFRYGIKSKTHVEGDKTSNLNEKKFYSNKSCFYFNVKLFVSVMPLLSCQGILKAY